MSARMMKRVLARYGDKSSVFVMGSLQDAKETIERLLDNQGIDYGKGVQIVTDNYKPLNLIKG